MCAVLSSFKAPLNTTRVEFKTKMCPEPGLRPQVLVSRLAEHLALQGSTRPVVKGSAVTRECDSWCRRAPPKTSSEKL